MIVTAVVCPAAPLLIAGLADRLAASVPAFLAACEQAAGALHEVDQVLILCAGRHRGNHAGAQFGPGDCVTAAGFARSDRAIVAPMRLPTGQPGVHTGASPDCPGPNSPFQVAAGTAVGVHLLARAGITASTTAVELGTSGPPPVPSGRVGLLVTADGAACHGEHAPGGPDPRSADFDEELVTALRSGDPAILAATCAHLADPATALRVDSLPTLAAMAQLTADAGPAAAAVLHYSAPFGVGYPVAVWQWG